MAVDADIRYALIEPLARAARTWVDVGGDGGGLESARATTADPTDLDAVRAAAEGDDVLVTVLDGLDRLPEYVPLVEALAALSQGGGATVVLAIPDHDAVDTPPENAPVFTAGSVRELRTLLPAGHVALRQVPLRGAAIVAEDAETATQAFEAEVAPAAPTHHILAFGPRAGELQPVAAVAQADVSAELGRLRALEADAALAAALVSEASAPA